MNRYIRMSAQAQYQNKRESGTEIEDAPKRYSLEASQLMHLACPRRRLSKRVLEALAF